MEGPLNVIPFPNIIRGFDKLNEYLADKIAKMEVGSDSSIESYEVIGDIVEDGEKKYLAVSMKLKNGEIAPINRKNIEYIICNLNNDRNINRNFDFAVVRIVVSSTFSASESNSSLYKIEISKK